MKQLFCFSLFTAFLAMSVSPTATADFVIAMGNSTGSISASGLSFTSGTEATLGIYGYNTATVAIVSPTNFGFAFDISAPGAPNRYDGKQVPGGIGNFFRNFSIAMAPSLGGTASIDGPDMVDSDPSPGHDVFADLSAANVVPFNPNVCISNAILFANIKFQISPNASAGTYGFKFVPGAQFNGGGLANSISGGLVLAAVADGSSTNNFTVVTSVPEPSMESTRQKPWR